MTWLGSAGRTRRGDLENATPPMADHIVAEERKPECEAGMTGAIAHEVNNALAVIVGNLELISSRPGDEDRAIRLAERALQAAELARRHTQRLLKSPGRQSLPARVVNTNQLLLELEERIWRVVGETAWLEMIFDPELVSTSVDAGRLELAILDLVAKASEAIPSSAEGRITIRTRNASLDEEEAIAGADSKAGAYVVITVRDNRPGTIKKGKQSLNLDFGHIEAFARESGGHVRVQSKARAGTSVELWLAAYQTTAPAYISAQTSSPVHPSPNGVSVLVVDDDPGVLEVARDNLCDLGYQVTTAKNGQHALKLLRGSLPVDLLFSDVVMHEMSGVELAAEARRLRPDMKILLSSGYAPETLLAKHHLVGDMPPILAKPYRREQLARTISAVLRRDRPQQGQSLCGGS